MRNAAAALAALAITFAAVAPAQRISQDDRVKIEAAVQHVLEATKVPSASVGIARGGKVVYTQGFGDARLSRNVGVPTSATGGEGANLSMAVTTSKPVKVRASMAYPIGSISKQFTAACVLLLQERGKLKLDDPVAKWFPNLTRANDITIRNLLTHTSGYSDFAPQDYTIPAWTKTAKPIETVTEWASKPLDFEPGTKWQYSNTNFELAALIVEKVSGMRFHEFLWQNVITPLKLEGVLDLDTDRNQLEVLGYEQHALGPLRPAIMEAPGWYYGDAQLAMPVATLLLWDESIVHRTLLKPESYDAMETEYKLKDGSGSHYGLGVFVRVMPNGRKVIYHSGEVGGFVSSNVVVLDDDVAFAALTNEEASSAAGAITNALRPILLPSLVTPKTSSQASGAPPAEQANVPAAPPAQDSATHQVQQIVADMQTGKFDKSVFTEDALFYFTPETVEDFYASLAPMGPLTNVEKTSESLRGGMTFRSYKLRFEKGEAALTTYTMKDGKLEQFLISPAQ